MAFGKQVAEPTRVYQYGCLTPISGEAEAVDQMRRGVAFWNQLVALDRRFLDAIDALVIANGLEEPAKGSTEEAWADYWRARKALCAEPEHAAQIDVWRQEKIQASKAARHASGMYWQNREEVEARVRTAKRGPTGRLQFHAWRWAVGKVTVRYQYGLPVSEAFGQDTRFQIEPLKGDRSRHGCATLRLRVGSDGRDPIWLVLPVVLHRPLPAGNLIRSVSVLRERLGRQFRWKAVITVRLLEPSAAQSTASSVGSRPVAGIDIGWRLRPDGLRVAALADDQGAHHELVLPGRWLSEMRRVQGLKSTQDQLFNAMRSGLAAWLRVTEVPAWLTEATATLAQWRSIDRLVRLATIWRDQRFEGDAAIMEAFDFGSTDAVGLLGWRKKQLHLGEYEDNLYDQLLAHRLYRYRDFAAELARLYREVRIERFDLRPVIRRKKKKANAAESQPDTNQAEATNELPKLVRYYRFLVAPGSLRLAIRNACQREGVSVVEVPAKETTQRCSNCESLMDFDAARQLRHRCETCGWDWDQDLNAAKWILRGGVPPPPPADTDEPPASKACA